VCTWGPYSGMLGKKCCGGDGMTSELSDVSVLAKMPRPREGSVGMRELGRGCGSR